MSDPRLVDMEPGGESTQYESIREFTITPLKQTGQLGGNLPHTKSQLETSFPTVQGGNNNEEDERLARELGKGVTTAPGEDSRDDTQGDAETAKTRRLQGYGPGSDVGA